MTYTAAFLAAISPQAKSLILAAIGSHYGISQVEAFDEVTDPEAEHILDYMTGGDRVACSALMQKHGFR